MANHSDIIRKFERFMFGGVMQEHQGNSPCLDRWPRTNRRVEIDESNSTMVGVILDDRTTGEERFIRVNPEFAKLSEQYVKDLFQACSTREQSKDVINIHWYDQDLSLDSYRIEAFTDCIKALLSCLSRAFFSVPGGNLNWAKQDIEGNAWTQDLKVVEHLFILGMAASLVRFYPENKDIWKNFPEGRPYVSIRFELKSKSD